jgi:hypothetical protein
MSSPAALVALARELARVRPDLTNAERAELAVKIALADGVVLAGSTGTPVFDDNARAICPELPRYGDAALERKRLRDETKPKTPREPTALDTALAEVPGTSPKARSERARLREQHALLALGDKYKPTKESP